MPKWNVNFNTSVDIINPEIVQLVANTHAFSKVIRNIPLPPGVQKNLDALNIMRAVRGTTGIEGTELAEDEVIQILETPNKKRVLPANRKRDEQEARNAGLLMRYIARIVIQDSDIPLSEELICSIHRILSRKIDYPNNIPGKYRAHPVAAGTYVPPSTKDEISRLMSEFVNWFNSGVPKTGYVPILL